MKKRLLCFIAFISAFFLLFSIPINADADSDYLKSISFFGDSTTHGLIRYIVENDGRLGKPVASLSRDQILTPPDGTFYLRNLPMAKIRYRGKVLWLSEAFSKASPEILIVTVGVNGLTSWSEDSFKECYSRLIDEISSATPNTQIVLQSVYPIAKDRSQKLESFTADQIDRLNEWIKELANECNLPYLDTASVLKDDDGWLIPSYHNGDGMHLNTEGFNRVLGYIMEHPIQKGS